MQRRNAYFSKRCLVKEGDFVAAMLHFLSDGLAHPLGVSVGREFFLVNCLILGFGSAFPVPIKPVPVVVRAVQGGGQVWQVEHGPLPPAGVPHERPVSPVELVHGVDPHGATCVGLQGGGRHPTISSHLEKITKVIRGIVRGGGVGGVCSAQYFFLRFA